MPEITNKKIKAEEFVAGQRSAWDAAAPGWRKWISWLDAGTRNVDQRYLELARIESGQKILDLGTGLGSCALTSATITGSSGRVVGIDISPQMLAFARRTAEEQGAVNIEFIESDARSLPFENESFDAVLCRSSLMLMPEPESVLEEAYRVLRPRGSLTIIIPGMPPETPMISLAIGVIRSMVDMPPPSPGTPHFYTLSQPGTVEDMYRTVGFEVKTTERLSWVTTYQTAAEYVEFLQEIAPQVTTLVNSQPEEIRTRIWNGIRQAAEAQADDVGMIALKNIMVCIAGWRTENSASI